MIFDLSTLIQRHEGLNNLEGPFTSEEIDEVVKQLPNDKSLGPDGFTEFMKKCWSVIKSDFYELCWTFQANNICLSISIHLSSP